MVGVITGAVISVTGNIISHWYKEKPIKELEEQKMKILKEMLEHKDYSWRELSKLSSVIGSTKDETRRLLIKIKARCDETACEKENSELWGLLSRHPLKNIKPQPTNIIEQKKMAS